MTDATIAPAVPGRARRAIGAGFARNARRALVPLGLLALWQLAATQGWVSPRTLPAPTAVWETFWHYLGTGELVDHGLVSLRRVVLGLAIGGFVGTAAGLIAGLSRFGEEIIDTPLQMLRTLPALGLLPLFMTWFGIGESLKVALVVVGVVFPIYLNLHKGIRGVDHRFAELAQSQGATRGQVIRQVILPGALPSYLVGIRFALGIAWLCLVVGETVNAEQGIGFLMMRGREFMRTDLIIMALIIYALLGLVTEILVRQLERRALSWRKEYVR